MSQVNTRVSDHLKHVSDENDDDIDVNIIMVTRVSFRLLRIVHLMSKMLYKLIPAVQFASKPNQDLYPSAVYMESIVPQSIQEDHFFEKVKKLNLCSLINVSLYCFQNKINKK